MLTKFGCARASGLDRKVLTIAPLAPGTQVVSQPRIADKPERQIRMSRAVSTLTIRNRFLVRRYTLRRVHRLESVRAFEKAFGIEVLGPFQVHGTGNPATASSASDPRRVLVLAACIDQDGVRRMQPRQNVFTRCEQLTLQLHPKVARLWDGRFIGDGHAGCRPCVEAAIKDVHVRMPEEFQEPKKSSGTHPGYVIIDDDLTVDVHSFGLDEVFDDPQEGVQCLLPRVDQADAENVETACSRNVTVGIGFRWTKVQQNQPGIVQATTEVLDRP